MKRYNCIEPAGTQENQDKRLTEYGKKDRNRDQDGVKQATMFCKTYETTRRPYQFSPLPAAIFSVQYPRCTCPED